MAAKAELDAGKKRNIVKRRRKEEDEKSHVAGNGNSTHDPPVILAWIDAKFTVKKEAFGEPLSETQTDKYISFHDKKLRPTAAKHMPPEEMARYKYQIDFGGGGGTTFGSTAAKLAMPGLLFHHVTPTKDYFHDDLVPWVHYVPLRTCPTCRSGSNGPRRIMSRRGPSRGRQRGLHDDWVCRRCLKELKVLCGDVGTGRGGGSAVGGFLGRHGGNR